MAVHSMSTLFHSRLERILEKRKDLLLKLSEKEVILPTINEIVEVNKAIVQEHKGEFRVRNYEPLSLAIKEMQNKEGDIYALAGIPFFRIVRDRPFIEGNKRTAVVATEMFLEQNGAHLTLSNDRLYTLAIRVAKGEITEGDVAEELRDSPTQPRRGLSPGLRP